MTDQPRGSGFSTLAIHAGAQHDPAAKVIHASVDQIAGYLADTIDPSAAPCGLHGLSCAAPPNHPTISILEERIAALEGGAAALATASGPAAHLLAFHTLMQPGDEFVAAGRLSQSSVGQFGQAFKSFGWQVRWADAEKPESLVEALSDKTKAIFIESIAEPSGALMDIEAVANVARRARVPLIVDNTLATPYVVRPLEHGADIVVHSATRILAGNAAAVGGLIVDGGTFDWLQDGRYPALSMPSEGSGGMVIGETFGNFAFSAACRMLGLCDLGASLSPSAAALILNGIETLPLRLQRQCDNALAVAEHLSRHSAVAWVRYAGLAEDPDHELARRYAPRGAGCVFTFGLANGGHDAGPVLVERLRLFSPVANIGDTRSFVALPASSTPHRPSNGQAARVGAGEDVVRVSIGLEDAGDIIADLDQALQD